LPIGVEERFMTAKETLVEILQKEGWSTIEACEEADRCIAGVRSGGVGTYYLRSAYHRLTLRVG